MNWGIFKFFFPASNSDFMPLKDTSKKSDETNFWKLKPPILLTYFFIKCLSSCNFNFANIVSKECTKFEITLPVLCFDVDGFGKQENTGDKGTDSGFFIKLIGVDKLVLHTGTESRI